MIEKPIKTLKFYRSLFLFYTILLLVFASFTFGFFLGGSEKKNSSSSSDFFLDKKENLNFFKQVYQSLEKKYVNKSLIDPEKLFYGSIKGMVESLDDPYSTFMTPKEVNDFKEEMDGSFEGIGAEIGIKKKNLVIIAPLESSPAEKAGLKPEDLILKIDEKEIADLSLEEAVKLIRGPKQTKVVLLIFREGFKEPKEFEIIREKIEIKSVTCRIEQKNIAYFKISHFSEKTSDEFKDCVEKINSPANEQNPKKVILDLRNNPGGFLQSSIEISSFFFKEKTLVTFEETSPEKKKEFKTQGNGELANFPLVVLINQGSASASEIVAGCLKDYQKAILVGEKTFGKGSVQDLEYLSNGSALRLTVAKWLTPKGTYINETGITPDQESSFSADDWEKGKDTQLEKAIEILK